MSIMRYLRRVSHMSELIMTGRIKSGETDRQETDGNNMTDGDILLQSDSSSEAVHQTRDMSQFLRDSKGEQQRITPFKDKEIWQTGSLRKM